MKKNKEITKESKTIVVVYIIYIIYLSIMYMCVCYGGSIGKIFNKIKSKVSSKNKHSNSNIESETYFEDNIRTCQQDG